MNGIMFTQKHVKNEMNMFNDQKYLFARPRELYLKCLKAMFFFSNFRGISQFRTFKQELVKKFKYECTQNAIWISRHLDGGGMRKHEER